MPNLATETITAVIDKGAEVTFRARLLKEDGAALAEADLSSISMKIFDYTDLATAIVIGSGSVTALTIATSTAGSTFDTSNWSKDDIGYNFSLTYDTASFLSGGHTYRVEIKIVTSSIGNIYIPVILVVRKLST